MFQECRFCKEKDLQQHVPSLCVDMRKAIESGTIPPTANVEDFNNMDIETAEGGVRLREPFDAIEYERQLAQASTEFHSGTPKNPDIVSTSPEGESNAV